MKNFLTNSKGLNRNLGIIKESINARNPFMVVSNKVWNLWRDIFIAGGKFRRISCAKVSRLSYVHWRSFVQ